MSDLSTDLPFDLLVAVAGRALVDRPPVPESASPAKKPLSVSSSSSNPSSAKKKNALPKAQSSTGSFFIEDSEDGQTVYRRASVYFSIVKSSRKFPGYFNPAEKRIIVHWYVSVFFFFFSSTLFAFNGSFPPLFSKVPALVFTPMPCTHITTLLLLLLPSLSSSMLVCLFL